MSKDTYREYLQSEHWKQVKLEWYSNEQNRKCKFCGDTNNLDIHHKRYRTRYRTVLGRENTKSSQRSKCDLITLCRTCHFTYHEVVGNHKTLTMRAISRIKRFVKQGYTIRQSVLLGINKKSERTKIIRELNSAMAT